MRIRATLNAKAGALLDENACEIAQRIEEQLRSAGDDMRLELVEPADIDAAMDRALADEIDVLVVGGGDGTIKAAAAKLVGKPVALGIIPLGTLNRVARDLKIPFEPLEAAKTIVEGEPIATDVADVNGHMFLSTSLLGLPIRVAEQRQALRGASLGQRIKGFFTLLRNFLTNRRRFTIQVDDGHLTRRVRALSIAISNNPLSESANMMLTRACVNSGQLALYLSKHRTGGAMSLTVLQRMLGDWRSDPDVEEFRAQRIVLSSHRPRVRVSNDGEIEELTTPLRYSIKPRVLQIMVPKSA